MRYLFFVFWTLSFSHVCLATEQFHIEFTLKAQQSDRVFFPDGFIVGSPWQRTQYPHYSSLGIKTAATARVLSDSTVRFEFVEPVSVKTITVSGTTKVEETTEYRYVDMRFSEEDLQHFVQLQAYRHDEFYLREGTDSSAPFDTLDKLLKYAQTGAPLEAVADASYDSILRRKIEVPELYVFDGHIHLGEVSFADFQKNQNVSARIANCILQRVAGFDAFRLVVHPAPHFQWMVFSIEKFLERPPISAFNREVAQFLKLQEKIFDIRMRKMGLVFTAEEGQVQMKPAERDANVVHHDFGGKCSALLGREPLSEALAQQRHSVWTKWWDLFRRGG